MEPEPLLLSATQIQLWEDCKRKWGFRYVEHIETPQHPSTALGTDTHDNQIAPYLTQGRGFDFTRPSGEIAQALVPLLPPPMSPGLVVERGFVMPSPSGLFAYRGSIDLYMPSSVYVPELCQSDYYPLLGDFKTTSNLAYAKTADVLRTDIQAQLYSMALMFEDNVNTLDLVWFYTRTRKPHRAQRTYLRVTAPHVAEQFQRIDAIGKELVTTGRSVSKADELPPNPRMCEAYGGCPYRNRCNLSPAVHAAGVNVEAIQVTQATNSFLANLRKTVPGAPPVPGPAPALPAWSTAPVDPMHVHGGVAASHAAAVHAPPAINPPETHLPPAPPVGAAAPVVVPPTAAPTVAAAPAPRGPGRPRKNAAEAPPAPVTAPTAPPAPAGETPIVATLEGVATLAQMMKAIGITRVVANGVEVNL